MNKATIIFLDAMQKQNKLKNKITGIVSAQAFFFSDRYISRQQGKNNWQAKGIHRVGEKFSIIFSVS